VHGFNVNRVYGGETLIRFADLIQGEKPGAMVVVLWPGDSWIGPISYPFEGTNADDTGTELSKFIRDHLDSGTALHFVAHSLGSRVVMRAVELLVGSPFPVSQICLMAAAIDDDALANSGAYRRAALSARRVAVVFSGNDNVLKWAYPAGDLLQAFIYWNRDTAGLALGLHGPRDYSREPSQVPETVVAVPIPHARQADHGDYLPPSAPTELNKEQASAARVSSAVLGGRSPIVYV
jgi:hypothetical protein